VPKFQFFWKITPNSLIVGGPFLLLKHLKKNIKVKTCRTIFLKWNCEFDTKWKQGWNRCYVKWRPANWILSDFASRSKQGLNKAELFILPSVSVVVSSNRRFYYFAFKIKEEFAMRLSPERWNIRFKCYYSKSSWINVHWSLIFQPIQCILFTLLL